MTDIKPSKSAIYQRERRLKAKLENQEEKDIIERQIEAQAKRIKQVKIQRKREDLDIESDDWGREVEHDLVKQYPKQENTYDYNFWGQCEGIDNPLNRISHQENLRKLFFDRAE